MSPNCIKRHGNYQFTSITSWFPDSTPFHSIYHNIHAISSATDRQMTGRNDDNIWSAVLYIASSNASPKSQSTTPAICRPSAASSKMRSELPLKAALQNSLKLPAHFYSQERLVLSWHIRAPVTAESLVSTWRYSIRQRATIATTVVIDLMTPTTFSTTLRSRQHWLCNRYGLRRQKPPNTSTWRMMRRADNNNNWNWEIEQ